MRRQLPIVLGLIWTATLGCSGGHEPALSPNGSAGGSSIAGSSSNAGSSGASAGANAVAGAGANAAAGANAVAGAGANAAAGAGGSAQSGGSAGNGAGGSAQGGTGGAKGGLGPIPAGVGPTSSMRPISKNVPVFASSIQYNSSAAKAADGDPATQWTPTGVPAWIAYDLSAVPVAQRQDNLVVWNNQRPGYIFTAPDAFSELPLAYTIEINTQAGGSQPPSSGWTTVATVQGNDRGTMQHLVKLAGANWVRMSITQASDPQGAMLLDLDIFSAPSGATDSWLFMGDSITFMSMTYTTSDLPSLVQKLKPERFPAIVVGAISGTSARSAVSVIEDTMKGFPGQFVVLAYGTNDLGDEFPANMEQLVKKVIASGRVPVVPHMPWSDQRIDRAPIINAAIDVLYAKYPQILRGPDLWTVFKDRNDLIPPMDLHPNDTGKEVLRKEWAAVMANVP